MLGKLTFTIPFRFGFKKTITVEGGPYYHKPQDRYGVCLLESPGSKVAIDVWMPIKDFSVPEDDQEVRDTIRSIIKAGLNGRTVYVGCMAGQGRTGLMLTLLSKALLDQRVNPLAYVREHYYSRAVETRQQEQYVAKFSTTGVARDAAAVWLESRLSKFHLGWLAKYLV